MDAWKRETRGTRSEAMLPHPAHDRPGSSAHPLRDFTFCFANVKRNGSAELFREPLAVMCRAFVQLAKCLRVAPATKENCVFREKPNVLAKLRPIAARFRSQPAIYNCVNSS